MVQVDALVAARASRRTFAILGTTIERKARKTRKASLFFAGLAAFAFLVVVASAQARTATATFAADLPRREKRSTVLGVKSTLPCSA